MSDQPRRILLAEDDRFLRKAAETTLKQQGYTVMTAADGEEAQRVCQDHRGPIHIALVDVMLPGQGGRAVAEWITQQRPEIRIVFMSGYTYDAITHHNMLEPGTTLVQKPFTTDTLIRTIREALS